MIVRMWSGRVRAREARQYEQYLRRTGLADYKATRGNRGVVLLSRRVRNEVEFTFITFWDSIAAIRRFAGDDYERARYYPLDRKLLLHRSRFVKHYEILENTRR
jgi:heme-degrading monooxygenase HmoA